MPYYIQIIDFLTPMNIIQNDLSNALSDDITLLPPQWDEHQRILWSPDKIFLKDQFGREISGADPDYIKSTNFYWAADSNSKLEQFRFEHTFEDVTKLESYLNKIRPTNSLISAMKEWFATYNITVVEEFYQVGDNDIKTPYVLNVPGEFTEINQ